MFGKEIRAASFQEYASLAAKAASQAASADPSFLYRGHADAEWLLEPLLTRVLATVAASHAGATWFENLALQTFWRRAHLHLDMQDAGGGIVALWGLMAHHGAPTRLLDWSASPYVAAYFACCEEYDKDGLVWTLPVDSLAAENKARFGDEAVIPDKPLAEQLAFFSAPDPATMVIPVRGGRWTRRMLAQQGYFTVSRTPLSNHLDIVEKCAGEFVTADKVMRVRIPAASKGDFLRNLKAMNIGADTLYPDADGLGRSVGELARLIPSALDVPVELEPPQGGTG